MIRQKISSNLEAMDELNAKHSWIPGATSIRPNPETVQKKANYMTNILNRYATLQDLVLHRFFGLKATVQGNWADSKLHVLDSEISTMKNKERHEFRFVPNNFPYHVPSGTNHYVIWFLLNGNEATHPTTHSPLTDDEINSSIEIALQQLLGSNHDTFCFVWYPNPKPTVISNILYHVQVFWIR